MSAYSHYRNNVVGRGRGGKITGAKTTYIHEADGWQNISALLARAVYIVGGVVVGLLVVRFILSLLALSHTSGLSGAIFNMSHPFVMPFFGLFNYRIQYGVPRFEVETLIAAAIYAIVVLLVGTILSIPSQRESL